MNEFISFDQKPESSQSKVESIFNISLNIFDTKA